MTVLTSRTRVVGLLVAGLSVVAACSGETPAADDASPSTAVMSAEPLANTTTAGEPPAAPITDAPVHTNTAASPAQSTPVTTAPPAAAETTGSPLDEYLAGRFAHSGDLGESFERWQRVFEDAMARCMGDEGFEYVPYVTPMQITVVDGGIQLGEAAGGAAPGSDLPPDEYTAQFGYGISTVGPADRSAVDPNDAIVDAMGVAERVAYFQAMYGASQSLDGQGYPNAEIAGDPASCYARAVAAAEETEGDADTAPAERAAVDAAFASLLEQVAGIDDRVNRDERVVTAAAAWSECLAAAGYPGYTDLNAPQADVAARARQLMGDAFDPANADPARLAELQRFEVGLAVADRGCRVPFDATYEAVRRELEQRFAEEHRGELEEYRDALAALGG